MKRLIMTLLVLGLTVTVVAPAFCEEPGGWGHHDGYRYGPGYGWGQGHMMEHGPAGWGGMHGNGRRWNQSPGDWQSMKPNQQKKWQKMRTAHLMDTMELRKQLAAKQIELQTLWRQPNVDRSKIDKLSNELADLRAKLSKKRDEFLLQCRQKFGDRDWACPGSGW